MLRAGALLASLALGACATATPPAPINVAATTLVAIPEIQTGGEQDLLMFALSGGGARAAAFGLGVLEQARDTRAADGRPLTDHVVLITSVSGGSILAAYYGLNGADRLETFRAAYLDKNWQADLHMSPASPLNWRRALSGGLNGPDRLADWLDTEVFDGARMAPISPYIWLNATDLYNGAPFTFTQLYFNAVCSDLRQVRVADAVAASMAFPVVFEPVLIEPRNEHCAPLPEWTTQALSDRAYSERARVTARAFESYRDPAQLRYLHLSDGGVLDNLGLSALTLTRDVATAPNEPLTVRNAVRLRRLTMIVVNAENALETDWQNDARGPSGPQTAEALMDLYIADGNRAAYDNFRAALAAWQAELIAWRCAMPAVDVGTMIGDLPGWRCDDVTLDAGMISFRDFDDARRAELGAVPTRVNLPAATVDMLIQAGRDGLAHNEAVAAFIAP